MKYLFFPVLLAMLVAGCARETEPLRALIIDGQNNHAWEDTTPVLQDILSSSGRFTVDVATSPPEGADMSAFDVSFDGYDVVVSNYNGEAWPEPVQEAFEDYVRSGGGFAAVHAANNAFPAWPEYNQMIGLGGWGGRDETAGPYIRWRDGIIVRDTTTPGRGGSHGQRHAFAVDTREPEHPIMRGLPQRWMHAEDELYDRLRGPADNLTVLATAFSDPTTGGTGEHEPILMTINYGEGRVFHTVLGHNVVSMEGAGFRTTLLRGVEWAATGEATIPVPEDIPEAP